MIKVFVFILLIIVLVFVNVPNGGLARENESDSLEKKVVSYHVYRFHYFRYSPSQLPELKMKNEYTINLEFGRKVIEHNKYLFEYGYQVTRRTGVVGHAEINYPIEFPRWFKPFADLLRQNKQFVFLKGGTFALTGDRGWVEFVDESTFNKCPESRLSIRCKTEESVWESKGVPPRKCNLITAIYEGNSLARTICPSLGIVKEERTVYGVGNLGEWEVVDKFEMIAISN